MRKSIRDTLAICNLEIGLSYSFPVIEGIVVIFFFITYGSILLAFGSGPYVTITPGPTWNATQMVAFYDEYRSTMAVSIYGVSALGFSYVLAFLIPLLTAFTLAGRFEDGTLHTFISYPINRFSFLMVKVSMMIVILGLSTTISILSAILFFNAGVGFNFSIILLIAALWSYIILLTCVTTLIGVLSKNAGVTTMIGLLLWNIIMLIIVMPFLPEIAQAVLNPIVAVSASFSRGTSELHIEEALIGIGGSSLIGVVALIISNIIFERSEIS